MSLFPKVTWIYLVTLYGMLPLLVQMENHMCRLCGLILMELILGSHINWAVRNGKTSILTIGFLCQLLIRKIQNVTLNSEEKLFVGKQKERCNFSTKWQKNTETRNNSPVSIRLHRDRVTAIVLPEKFTKMG